MRGAGKFDLYHGSRSDAAYNALILASFENLEDFQSIMLGGGFYAYF